MKTKNTTRMAKKVKPYARQRVTGAKLRWDLHLPGKPCKLGTKVLPGPGEPLAKSFVVQLVTAETIEAGFPFGLRLEVFADTPTGAVSQASDDFGRLASFIREQARAGLVDEISRCLGVN